MRKKQRKPLIPLLATLRKFSERAAYIPGTSSYLAAENLDVTAVVAYMNFDFDSAIDVVNSSVEVH